MKKICSNCKKEKFLKEFHQDKRAKDGLRCECILCRKQDSKEYYLKNKIRIKKQTKIYREVHKEEQKDYSRIYKNKRRKTDIDFRLLECLRNRLHWALKNNNKIQKTINLIGCNIKFLKKYLENQFKSNMSWDNYGLWHIDHIKPCCTFDLSKTSEQRKCFNFKNLRPLWKIENLQRPKGLKCLN
jgi:hypothetical protein